MVAELEETIVLNPAEIQPNMNRRAKPLSGDPTCQGCRSHDVVLRCLESCLDMTCFIGGSRETRSTDQLHSGLTPQLCSPNSSTSSFNGGRRAYQLHGSSPTYLFHRTKRWTWWTRQKQGVGKLVKSKLIKQWLPPPSLGAMFVKLLLFSHRLAMFCHVLPCLAMSCCLPTSQK